MPNTARDFIILVREIHATLRSILHASQNQIDAINEYTKAYKESCKPQPAREPERVRNEIHLTPEETNRYYAEQAKSHRLQQRTFWVSIGTLIVIGIYTGVTYSQWQTTRQSLVGIQAATVTLGFNFYGDNMLWVEFDQHGIAAAKYVRFVFHAVRKTLPNLANIGSPVSHTAYEPVLSDKTNRGPQTFGLPGLTSTAMEAMRRTEQTVMVTGTFSYNNGFEDVRPEKICFMWLAYSYQPKGEAVARSAGFVPCASFSAAYQSALELIRNNPVR